MTSTRIRLGALAACAGGLIVLAIWYAVDPPKSQVVAVPPEAPTQSISPSESMKEMEKKVDANTLLKPTSGGAKKGLD